MYTASESSAKEYSENIDVEIYGDMNSLARASKDRILGRIRQIFHLSSCKKITRPLSRPRVACAQIKSVAIPRVEI